jgi:hypothetical protein
MPQDFRRKRSPSGHDWILNPSPATLLPIEVGAQGCELLDPFLPQLRHVLNHNSSHVYSFGRVQVLVCACRLEQQCNAMPQAPAVPLRQLHTQLQTQVMMHETELAAATPPSMLSSLETWPYMTAQGTHSQVARPLQHHSISLESCRPQQMRTWFPHIVEQLEGSRSL